MSEDVNIWLSAILSKDSITFEDAYWDVRPPVEEAIPKIIEALKVTLDAYTRGKLIELLGECGNLTILPILEEELKNADSSIQRWAILSIEALKRSKK